MIPTDLNVRKLKVIIGDFTPTGEIPTEAIRTKEIRIAMDLIEEIRIETALIVIIPTTIAAAIIAVVMDTPLIITIGHALPSR